jgi:hypothetical protein
MLYHSFPRDRKDNPSGKDIKILENILKYGLLLVPDIVPYPGTVDENGKKTGGFNLIQCRFCMTAINDTKLLKKHAEIFGDIHLEFTDKDAYEIGAIPVMYVPKAPSAGAETTSLWHLAASFIHRLGDFQTIAAMLEYLDEAVTDCPHEKEITVISDTGCSKEINVSQLRDILELILEGTVNVNDKKEKKKKEFNQIQGAIQGLCSLFYFTDVLEEHNYGKYGYLHYFRQQEWRIIQGMGVYRGEQGKIPTVDRYLTHEERKAILDVDCGFFGKKLDYNFNGVLQPRIDLCRILPSINGKPIQSFINRIYVPKERYKEAVAMVKKNKCRIKKNGFSTDRIISYDKEQGIPINQEGVTT